MLRNKTFISLHSLVCIYHILNPLKTIQKKLLIFIIILFVMSMWRLIILLFASIYLKGHAVCAQSSEARQAQQNDSLNLTENGP